MLIKTNPFGSGDDKAAKGSTAKPQAEPEPVTADKVRAAFGGTKRVRRGGS